MNTGKKHIRRLGVHECRSIGSIVDLLSLLPPDTLVVNLWFDMAQAQWTLYLENPEFSEVEVMNGIPELQVIEETRRTFFGSCMVVPTKIVDPETRREFFPS